MPSPQRLPDTGKRHSKRRRTTSATERSRNSTQSNRDSIQSNYRNSIRSNRNSTQSNRNSTQSNRNSTQSNPSSIYGNNRKATSIFSEAAVKDEETQTGTGCRNCLIVIIVVLIVLAGSGAGIYFRYPEILRRVVTTLSGVTTLTSVTELISGTTTVAVTVGPPPTRAPTQAPVTEPPTTVAPMQDDKWAKIRGDCGRPRNKPSLGRIVGGDEAVKHSWPWQIGLLKYKQYDENTATVRAICGGTIVGPRFVITAVHCFLNSARTSLATDTAGFRIIIGGHDKGKETHGAEMIVMESINHHPKNNLATFSKKRQIPVHDIAVLVLKTTVNPKLKTPITDFACLPQPTVIPPIGKKCWATGWGVTRGTGSPNQLKQVVQPIVSQTLCKKKYGKRGISLASHLCAGPHQGEQGTCQGDSGGPLVCQYDDGTWVLHGATSFGPQPCGISPGVWVQVSYHMRWICCILKDYGPCTEIGCKM